jgi:RNase P/RNase MRP subunit POP5
VVAVEEQEVLAVVMALALIKAVTEEQVQHQI